MNIEIRRIIAEMRSERPRYKSHDLGFVDSVSASRVDDWADELEAISARVREMEDAILENEQYCEYGKCPWCGTRYNYKGEFDHDTDCLWLRISLSRRAQAT